MLPVSIFMIAISMMIVYAKINWEPYFEGVWYGPNNPPYTDDTASFTTDRADFDSYVCPPPPIPPITGGGVGVCIGVDCSGGADPIIVPPYIPPPVTGDSDDSF